MMRSISTIVRMIVVCGIALGCSGCIIRRLIHAPDRSLISKDLLLVQEELPDGWLVFHPPIEETDNRRPEDSLSIAFCGSKGTTEWDIKQWVFRYTSIEHAKNHYAEDVLFPGETDNEEWSFVSVFADEQHFSCYTYSNIDYPVCTWTARYQEILIMVVGWVNPERMSLEDMQNIVIAIDEKVTTKMGE